MNHNPNLIYCAARLFAAQDRLVAAMVADAISASLNAAKLESYKVFLPFRDTSQDGIVSENKSHWIYGQDIQFLENSAAVVALVDGVSKDDGVTMELGFAFGKGTPYLLCTSDFVWQEPHNAACQFLCDPLVDYFAATKVAINSSEKLSRTLPYQEAHLNLLDILSREVGHSVVKVLVAPDKNKKPVQIIDSKNISVFIDIAGGRYAWCNLIENEIRKKCRFKNLVFGCRWLDGCSDVAIEADFHNLCRSHLCVVFGDTVEVDAGSAFLHGTAVALGLQTMLFYSRPSVIRGPGGQTMWRNLMLAESSTWQPTSVSELVHLIEDQTG